MALEYQTVQPGWGGTNTDAAPDYLATNEGVQVENFLTDRDGKLVLRGPVNRALELPEAAVTGLWVHDDTVLYAGSTSGTVHQVDMATGTVVAVAGINDAVYAPHARLGSFVYGIADASSDRMVVKWDPTIPSALELANAPIGSHAVATHLNRLFLLLDANGSYHLSWSDPGGPTADTAAEWQDDVSGLDNKIVLDANIDETAMQIVSVNRMLVVLLSDSVHVLVGDGPSSWSLRRLSSSLGCSFPESVAVVNQGVYFVSKRYGLCWTDGTDVRTGLSRPVQRELLGETFYATRCDVVPLDNEYLLLATDTGPQRVHHAPTGRWSTFESSFFAPYDIQALGRTPNYTYVATDTGSVTELWMLDAVTMPDAVIEDLMGFDSRNGDDPARIAASFYSRLVRLSSPARKSALHRLLLDYRIEYAGVVSPSEMRVSLVDGLGNVVFGPTALEPTDGLYRSRVQFDTFQDITDVQLRVETTSTHTAPMIRCELYDATIEFETSSQRSNS